MLKISEYEFPVNRLSEFETDCLGLFKVMGND